MLRKKEVYTNITPIPSHVPRQLAIDILHSHSEIITLNPLVIEHHPVKAPRDATADEYYSTWYEITERIQYVPGLGKMGSGKITFRGCFHDMPWGLQTHMYAPMNIDLRNKWRISGNQPGEPKETRELGLAAPADGLYLREDIEIRCNITMVSFVKAQLKAASKILVDRLIKKAELLDSGELHAMMENGRLKTINPADRSSVMPGQPQPLSPRLPYQTMVSPNTYSPNTSADYVRFSHPPHHAGGQNVVMELPGDFYHPGSQQDSTYLKPPSSAHFSQDTSTGDYSSNSPDTQTGRWSDYQSSVSSRPTSYASDTSGFRSPGLEQKTFSAELPAMKETKEEYDSNHAETLRRLEARHSADPAPRYEYNPQDYAKFPSNGKVNHYHERGNSYTAM